MSYIKTGLFAVAFGLLSVSEVAAWNGRAVPLAFDAKTNRWSVLLGRDVKTGFWSDFFDEAAPGAGEKGNTVAQNALSRQTRGVYTPTITGQMPWVKTPKDDFVHFVKVDYKPAPALNKSATNAERDMFAWIPVDEFLKPGRVSRHSINVSDGVKTMIQQYWTQVYAQLPSQQATPADTWASIPGALLFYEAGKPYYEFTNFADGFPFTINGEPWNTSEQYYQAQKFVTSDPALYQQIKNFRTDATGSAARKAFDLAQINASKIDQAQWQAHNIDYMLTALRAKFGQNPALLTQLENTGNAVLVEDSPRDPFWGRGSDSKGANHLGQLLMHVRDELRTGTQTPYLARDLGYYLSSKPTTLPPLVTPAIAARPKAPKPGFVKRVPAVVKRKAVIVRKKGGPAPRKNTRPAYPPKKRNMKGFAVLWKKNYKK